MSDLTTSIPAGWELLTAEVQKSYFQQLSFIVERERQHHTIYPPSNQTFTALKLTPYQEVKVLILGQDPYHNKGQAHGLAFSVPPGQPHPPSLRNIFKEMSADVGTNFPQEGTLVPWAKQGVLLLNTVLTVRAHQAHSHKGIGWENFTDAIIHRLNEKETPVIFVLWGNPARRKRTLINDQRHIIIESAHPSPLSAHRGFFGSQPFTRINDALRASGQQEIEWKL
ncbi:uracil-DNA glycosylase [Mechercharimyces sp. CAU 1602]|uniref:uracil-DNA glycosylase n=1 Tax=Mechercharimyces sp. CAU 1602 TaxID=2973933 RepID=UPI002162031B|nr:uracil-DNA glycosylase [Mechercharimyces sp. CAU 1602]MCS1352333.1 uracil-DNA glycosylase [Mechercharimyces sp. CAU 1602]